MFSARGVTAFECKGEFNVGLLCEEDRTNKAEFLANPARRDIRDTGANCRYLNIKI